jgi:hypothetical protein
MQISFLLQSVTKLQKPANFLSQRIKEMDDVQNELDKINGSKADAIKKIALMFK